MNKTLGFSALALVGAICLTSCGGGVAGKGWSRYKEENDKVCAMMNAKASYGSCKYVHITGDGTYEAGNLKDVVYYVANFTLSYMGSTVPVTSYPVYYSAQDLITEYTDSSLYYTALDLVSNGSLAGTTGTL